MAEQPGTHSPPIHLWLRFCPVCGRDDLSEDLLDGHLKGNLIEFCPGIVETLRYDLAHSDLAESKGK
jgi:hypothetical protein